jgi:hypothetical protein
LNEFGKIRLRYEVGIVVHYFSKDESKILSSSCILNPSDPEASKSIQYFLELMSKEAYVVIMCPCHSVSDLLLYGGSVGPLIAISLRTLVSAIIPPF